MLVVPPSAEDSLHAERPIREPGISCSTIRFYAALECPQWVESGHSVIASSD
jgi:hypothetical protein